MNGHQPRKGGGEWGSKWLSLVAHGWAASQFLGRGNGEIAVGRSSCAEKQETHGFDRGFAMAIWTGLEPTSRLRLRLRRRSTRLPTETDRIVRKPAPDPVADLAVQELLKAEQENLRKFQDGERNSLPPPPTGSTIAELPAGTLLRRPGILVSRSLIDLHGRTFAVPQLNSIRVESASHPKALGLMSAAHLAANEGSHVAARVHLKYSRKGNC